MPAKRSGGEVVPTGSIENGPGRRSNKNGGQPGTPSGSSVLGNNCEKWQEDPMATPSFKITGAIIPDLVVALFTESQSAHGAIADLEEAGFGQNRVAIAFSAEGKKAQQEGSHKGHWGDETPPASEYSRAWKLRHWIEDDLHRSGAEQMSQQDTSAVQHGEHYSELDLHETLDGLRVPEERILLFDQILGADGVLVLVDAAGRSREAQALLEKNCGQIRTDSMIGSMA
jgi:hypothetical protein